MKLRKDKINLIIILLCIMLNTNSFFTLSIPIIINTILLLILLIINRETVITKNKFFFFLIIMNLIAALSIVINSGGIGSFLNLINFTMGIAIFSNISIKNENFKFLALLFLLIYVKMLLLSSHVWNDFLVGSTEINPNSVAQSLLLCYCIICIYFKNKKNKHTSFFLIPFTILTMMAIYKCNSRTILLALGVYIISTYMPIINKFVVKHLQLILSILVIIGLIIPYVYVFLYQKGYSFNIPFSDKTLYTGREQLWGYMLSSLNLNKLYYFIGVGTNYETTIGVIGNYHNWYLGILYTFGIVVYIIYFGYLLDIVSKVKKKEVSYAIITIFVIGFFETSALWISTQIYIFIIILFDKYNETEVLQNEEKKNYYIYSDV